MTKYFFALLLFALPHTPLHVKEAGAPRHWANGFALSLSGQQYFVPDISGALPAETAAGYDASNTITPYPGFRAGLGYEWKAWSVFIESGYTYIKGDNPLITDITAVPLLVKGGYSFFFFRRLSLTPMIGAGMVFPTADHYRDVIDMLLEQKVHSTGSGFLVNAGARAAWEFHPALRVFGSFSLDCVVETGGPIPLPQAELGVLLRPVPPRTVQTKPAVIPAPELPPPQEEPPPPQKEAVRRTWLVLFDPDETGTREGDAAVFGEIAQTLAECAEGSIKLHGYAAPYRSVAGQDNVSRERARSCVEMLTAAGVAEGAMTEEWHGAQKVPETSDGSDSQRRSVEIILEGWRYERGESDQQNGRENAVQQQEDGNGQNDW
jgi:outer membrane protein OmpA-like peptidoglycan-associated protein